MANFPTNQFKFLRRSPGLSETYGSGACTRPIHIRVDDAAWEPIPNPTILKMVKNGFAQK